jgi:hypothetical protein
MPEDKYWNENKVLQYRNIENTLSIFFVEILKSSPTRYNPVV